MARYKVTNNGDLGASRGDVFVDAGASEEAELDSYQLALVESHPDLSVELLDEAGDDVSSLEGNEDLPQFQGEGEGASSADSTESDKPERELESQNSGLDQGDELDAGADEVQ